MVVSSDGGSEQEGEIHLTPKEAELKPELYWFSVKTGLLVQIQNWDIDDETGNWKEMFVWTSDYRKMPNGLLISHGAEWKWTASA